jgi:hypothetical protein
VEFATRFLRRSRRKLLSTSIRQHFARAWRELVHSMHRTSNHHEETAESTEMDDSR